MAETYNAKRRPSYDADRLWDEFSGIQRAIPSSQRKLSFDALPTGSGSWDTGSGTTITVARSLVASTGVYVSGAAVLSAAASRMALDYSGGGRVIVYGPDTSTNAAFEMTSRRSDGSNVITFLAFTAAGAATFAGNITASGEVTIGANQEYHWSGSSQIDSPSDGVIRLIDAAGTSFSRLQFGGTTSSFPALKRNGADIEFRSADDTVRCSLLASSGTFSSGVSGTTWTGTGQIKTTVTTQQLALHYDADNHLAVTVSSTGGVTYDATGAGARHTFLEGVIVSAGGMQVSGGITSVGAALLLGSTAVTATGGNVYGIRAEPVFGTDATTQGTMLRSAPALSGSFTMPELRGIHLNNALRLSGAAITTQIGIKIDTLSGATTNYGIDVNDALRTDWSSTAGQTRLLVYDVDNATLERVTVGAADSGGAGFKVLRIPN